MRLRLFSDLHIEFADYRPGKLQADVVVLAGDIHVGVKGVQWVFEQDFGCPVLYVLGNHEFYGQVYPDLIQKIKEAAVGTEVQVLEDEAVNIGGVNFHGATLWTNFELFGDAPHAGFSCQQIMNDFKKIRRKPNYSKMRAMDVSAIHQRSLNWLGRSLEESDAETNVVITHHAPSSQSLSQRHRDDIVSAAYASDLEDFIRKHQPNYWFHGHIHSSRDYTIGNCRVVSNPKGYPGEENPRFSADGLIPIG